MADYQVVCFGKLIPGCGDKATVQKKVAALFKVQEAQIAPFFTGQRVVVKSGLTPEKAKQYQQALAKAGVEVQVESLSNNSPQSQQSMRPPTPQAPSKPAAAQAVQQTRAHVASPSASSQASAVPSASPPKNTQVAPALKVNDDYAVALTVQVDGQKLGNLQQTSVAPAGTEFETPPPVQAPALDLSHLSVADPGSGSLEPEKQEQAKPIDISHLSLG